MFYFAIFISVIRNFIFIFSSFYFVDFYVNHLDKVKGYKYINTIVLENINQELSDSLGGLFENDGKVYKKK
jgi:hypothetical protein